MNYWQTPTLPFSAMRKHSHYLALLMICLGSLDPLAAATPVQDAAPSPIVVTTFDDDLINGNCSLREAIQAANTDASVDLCQAGSGADTITLSIGTYELTRTGTDEDLNQTGDLDIIGALTILGVDRNSTILSATALSDRAVHILSGTQVTIQNMSITHGGDSSNSQLDGGTLRNETATLSLVGVDLSHGNAGRHGGGIYNAGGTITITAESVIRDNTAANGSGGGIYNTSGTITIDNSIINNNIATDGNGGGVHNMSTLKISNTWIHDNSTNMSGAGLYNAATAIITGTVLDANSAGLDGGNIYSGTVGEGSTLKLTSSELRSGLTGVGRNGAGIYNQGALYIVSSSFALNIATLGSALYSNALVQPVEFKNATIISNTLRSGSTGAAINNDGAAITFYNTLIGVNGPSASCQGLITSGGHNLDAGNSCSFSASGDMVNTNPKLGELPVKKNTPDTAPPLLGSPVINAGNNATCATLDIFQQSRPHGITCDIGARENNTVPIAGAAESYSTLEDTPLQITVPGLLSNDSDPDQDPLSVIRADWPTNGTLILNANGSFSYTPVPNSYGGDQFAYRISDSALVSTLVVVAITITPVNDSPVAGNDSFNMSSSGPLTISAVTLLTNDTDIENDGLFISAVSPVSSQGGSVVLMSGNIIYTPPRNFAGNDQFTYTASDGHGGLANGTVTVNVAMQHVYLPLVQR